MPDTPWIAGAMAAAMIGGAMTGMSLDTTPIERFSDPLETIPRHKMAAFDRKPQAYPPEHYEMETPEGTLSVAEVVTRRTRLNPPEWEVATYEYGPTPYLPGDDRLWQGASDHSHTDRTQPAAAPALPAPPARVAQPAPAPPVPADARALEPVSERPAQLQLANAQDTPVAARGGPRVVDVSAELAARN